MILSGLNPVFILTTVGIVVLLCFSCRKLLHGGGKLCSFLARIALRAVVAVGIFLAAFGSALNASYVASSMQAADALGDYVERSLIPWMYYCAVKYSLYMIPKFLLFIKNPLILIGRMAEAFRSLTPQEADVAPSFFRQPAPVLLQ